MFSSNTPSMLPVAVYIYMLLNPFTFIFEQMQVVVDDGVGTFFSWTGLFWLEQTLDESIDVL